MRAALSVANQYRETNVMYNLTVLLSIAAVLVLSLVSTALGPLSSYT